MRAPTFLAFIVFLAIAQPLCALAGPFGTKQAMTAAQLRAAGADLKLRKDDVYVARKMPRHLDGIEFYELWIDPTLGLCKLRAVGRTINTNNFGDQTKRAFQKYEEMLTEVYGQNKRFDFLQSGSIWSDDNDWSMALAKEERTLSTFWTESEGSSMKDSIVAIHLQANDLSSGKAYVDIIYEFENTEKCIEKSKQKGKSVL